MGEPLTPEEIAAAPLSTRDIARQRRRMTSDMGETDAERMARAALEGRRGVWEQEYAEAAARAAAPPVEPEHALHFDPSCEECAYLARPVVIRPPSPDRVSCAADESSCFDADCPKHGLHREAGNE